MRKREKSIRRQRLAGWAVESAWLVPWGWLVDKALIVATHVHEAVVDSSSALQVPCHVSSLSVSEQEQQRHDGRRCKGSP